MFVELSLQSQWGIGGRAHGGELPNRRSFLHYPHRALASLCQRSMGLSSQGSTAVGRGRRLLHDLVFQLMFSKHPGINPVVRARISHPAISVSRPLTPAVQQGAHRQQVDQHATGFCPTFRKYFAVKAGYTESHQRRPQSLPCARSLRHAQILQRVLYPRLRPSPWDARGFQIDRLRSILVKGFSVQVGLGKCSIIVSARIERESSD